MKLLKNRKGQIRIIEAFFASILILSAVALIPSQTTYERSNFNTLRLSGMQTIIALDSTGALSRLIEETNWTAMRHCVQSMLPANVWFNITIFDENMTPLNDVQISNGAPISSEIAAVEYVCASISENYSVYIIRLQLATAN